MLPNGIFLALPSQFGSTDEEVLAIAKREIPVERAAQVEGLMQQLAIALMYLESPSGARH